MRQRLYQTVTSLAAADGTITFKFPPVPQGLVWSGSITLMGALTAKVFPANQRPFYTTLWELQRNGTPVISATGEVVFYDVQAVGQEVMTLTGINMPLATPVTATWVGFSDDAATAPLLYPRLYGGAPAYEQVYTSTPGAPLDIVTVPDPATIQTVSGILTAASTSVDLIPAGNFWSLWAATLNVSAANSGTVAISCQLLAKISTSLGDVVALEPICVQASAVSATATVPLYGLHTGGAAVTMTVGAFTGTSLRVNGSLVLTPEIA